jgi:hypothetical protein
MKTFSQITFVMLTMSAVAVAQPAAPPAKDAKAPVVAPPREKAAPPATARTVPVELIDMAKASAGTWKCKGEALEDGSKVAITAVNKVKADLDKWWIAESMELKGMKTGVLKMSTFTTFDAASKKWRRIAMNNFGEQMVGTADATPVNAPSVFNLDVLGPTGAMQFRDHADPSDPKAGLKVWGEVSNNKGKSWTKVYEMTCKK